jgi:crotonobetaine/carnitine-CoA ligase
MSAPRADLIDVETVNELLLQGARRWPDQPWCRAIDGVVSRAGIVDQATRAGAELRRLGVEAGDHVVLVIPNSIDFLRCWFAVTLAGAISVAINPSAAEFELERVLERIPTRLVLADPSIPLPQLSVRVVRSTDLDGRAALPQVRVDPLQPVTYIQTSGSTGQPKFVIETHRMYALGAAAFPWWLGLSRDDVMLSCLPLSHINAQLYSTLGSYAVGAELVLLPKFSATTFWPDVAAHGVTQFNAIGAILEILLRREPSEEERAHRVRLCYTAPAPTPARHREIEERFGLRVMAGYALSESPFGLITDWEGPAVPGSMGRPRQHPSRGHINDVAIVREDGREAGAGEIGEIILRNPAITPGYFRDPDETKQVLRDGWLYTGDLGWTDPRGNFYFSARKKEIIRRRGENVSPGEIENVLNDHPEVGASAVIGVPSELSEDDIKAFVIMREASSVTGAELGSWCRSRLPKYKCPRYIEIVDELPLTETKKIAKGRLSVERNSSEVDLA